ncbi:GNAT family N-acetyltransferase [Futiania mangrovi]|uniref:GNAT family N-acetyltransferase n=1 Tax=Futiania mangrovi TaxID=2959716 RepID=A0A9J6P8C7_9PROT|nr:GNAT family N-acetyltransferase [Futiania mangrovii]MCP1335892.1 GNAT family N-acetyltransferase [Futiania mangrovii]
MHSNTHGLSVRIEPLRDRGRLSVQWKHLEAAARPAFFLSWTWIGTWLDTLAVAPWTVEVTRGEETVGLACFELRTAVRRKFVRSRTLFLNETGDPARDVVTLEYNRILCHPDCAQEAEDAALAALMDARGRLWDELYVRNAPPDFAARLEGLGLGVWQRLDAASAEMDLDAARAAGGVLETMSRNTRHQIRRSMRLYEERNGPLALTRAGTVAEALDFFERLGALHQPYWQARGKPGAFAHPHYLEMHRALIARAMPAGEAEVVRVRAGEHEIGYLYNFVRDGRVYFYLSGLRYEDDAKLKPGLVTHAMCAADHLERGAHVYDFMAGENRYKTQLGQEAAPLVSLTLQRRRLVFWLERAAKGLRDRFRPRS